MEAVSKTSAEMNVTADMYASIQQPGWMSISGQVTTEGGTPLCAMVLANGQHMFTCNPVGEYSLNVPLNADGEITLFVFCSGQAPFKQVLEPDMGDDWVEFRNHDHSQLIANFDLESISSY